MQQTISQYSPESYDECLKDEISQTYDCSQLTDLPCTSGNSAQQLAEIIQCLLLKHAMRHSFWLMYEEGERRNRQGKNLALKLAERMPKTIRNQVVSIVRYYEEHMTDQLRNIHDLVSRNHTLRQQLSSANDKLSQSHPQLPFPKKQNKPTNQPSFLPLNQAQQIDCSKDQRIEDLQNIVMDKNRHITQLNKQITDLYTRTKKYKKRVCELEAKSPIKPINSVNEGEESRYSGRGSLQ